MSTSKQTDVDAQSSDRVQRIHACQKNIRAVFRKSVRFLDVKMNIFGGNEEEKYVFFSGYGTLN